VGNVMEFYINFGLPGVIIGFVALGWLIGSLDVRGAAAERRADFPTLILCFLPGVATINPGGSLVEITGGAAAALLAAWAWQWVWTLWKSRDAASRADAARLRRLMAV